VVMNWWVDLAKEVRWRVLETPEGHAAEDETSEVVAAYLVREVPMDADEWVRLGTRHAAGGGRAASPTERRCRAIPPTRERARPYSRRPWRSSPN